MNGCDAGSMYHAGSRSLQDAFDTRRLADRLEKNLSRTSFTAEDTAFIASQAMFMLATADPDGFPDCSYKGACPVLCAYSMSTRWHFQATMAMACSAASAMCW